MAGVCKRWAAERLEDMLQAPDCRLLAVRKAAGCLVVVHKLAARRKVGHMAVDRP